MSTLWLRHTPRVPCPQSSNYIHSPPLRLSGSRGSNSVHLSLRTGYDSSDRTSHAVFFVLPSFYLSGNVHLYASQPPVRLHRTPPPSSVSVLSMPGLPGSLSAAGACAARDWNGASEFPRACWMSPRERGGIKFPDNSVAVSTWLTGNGPICETLRCLAYEILVASHS